MDEEAVEQLNEPRALGLAGEGRSAWIQFSPVLTGETRKQNRGRLSMSLTSSAGGRVDGGRRKHTTVTGEARRFHLSRKRFDAAFGRCKTGSCLQV